MGFGRAGVLGTPLMYYTRDVLRLENIILIHNVTLAATPPHQLKSELEHKEQHELDSSVSLYVQWKLLP